MTSTNSTPLAVGDVLEVVVEKVAHGGHFIARHEGAVIFVRHAIPGEKSRVVITSTGASFNRGDVVQVLEPSSDRVPALCKYAHRQGCGGCDFQHISLQRQRLLKAEVISEQFLRIAKMDLSVEVEEVGEPLHWRTRAIATTDHKGAFGFFAARSHSVVPINDCLIVVDEMKMPELASRNWKSDVRGEIAISAMGERNIALAPTREKVKARLTEGSQVLQEEVNGRKLQVSQDSFWQSHKSAPEVLSKAVLEYAQLADGDHVLDLYGGVGLFTSAVVDVIGSSGSVVLIEGSKSATSDAARNFAGKPNVAVSTGDVAKLLPGISKADVVILDPPRDGAGMAVVAQIARIKPRAVVYVACDPAALARDTGYFQDLGYSLVKIRAFDLFPMTHHIECVALYMPA